MSPANPAEVAGVDFSSARPDPVTLRTAGLRFVVGYLKPLTATGPSGMELRSADIARYRAAGLAVAVAWETTATRPLGGEPAGLADGILARTRATALGYPTSCVAFAAVDFDVSPAQLPTVGGYLAKFAQGWDGPAGGYGSFRLVEWLAANAPGLYRWQTAAWSGTDSQGRPRLSEHAHLYQRTHKQWPDIAGTDEDVLCAPVPWYGPALTPPTEEETDMLQPDERAALLDVAARVRGKDPNIDSLQMITWQGAQILTALSQHPAAAGPDPATLAAAIAAAIPAGLVPLVTAELAKRADG